MHGFSIQAVKEWRAQEFDAGRPSGLEDFYRAHGLCLDCRANGSRLLGCQWIDDKGKKHRRMLRPGLGVADIAARYIKAGQKWNYWLERCSSCGGSGKANFST